MMIIMVAAVEMTRMVDFINGIVQFQEHIKQDQNGAGMVQQISNFQNLLEQVDELDQYHKDYVFQQIQQEEQWQQCGWSITTTS